MPVRDVAEFILYIVPGFVALRIYQSFYPVKQQSTFAELGFSALYGVFIYIATRWLDQHLLGNCLYLTNSPAPVPVQTGVAARLPASPGTGTLSDSSAGLATSVSLVLVAMTLAFAVGLLLALLEWLRFAVRHVPVLGRVTPRARSLWEVLFDLPANQRPNRWVVVYLRDQSIYVGWVRSFVFNPDLNDQEFLLADAQRVDEDLTPLFESRETLEVYLHTQDVVRIEFIAEQGDSDAEPEPPGGTPLGGSSSVGAITSLL